QGGRYRVQTWEANGEQVRRYGFHPGPAGQPMRLASIEDPSGQGVDLEWESDALLRSVRQRPERRELQLGYNRLGRVERLSLRGTNGEVHLLATYEYDASGRLCAAADAAGFAERWEYDREGRLAREIARDGGVFHLRYDPKGRCVHRTGLNHYDEKRIRYLDAAQLTEVTNSYGETWRYQTLPSGQIVSEWDPAGGQRRTEYDAYGRVLALIDAMGAVTGFSYDADGNRNSVTNALGHVTQLRFDAHHLPLALTDALGNTWTRSYDEHHRVVVEQDPFGRRWQLHRDDSGYLVEVVNPLGAIKQQHFADGVLQSLTDWMGQVTRFEHDAFGRVTARVGPQGDTTRMRYDVIGRLIQVTLPDGTILYAAYDHAGNMTRFVDALGHSTRWRFGPCNRLLERADALEHAVRFVWGSEPGRLDQLINENGEAYSFVRDAAGRIVREVSFDASEREFRYNAQGETIGWTNAQGEAVAITRNPLQQVVGQELPNGERLRFDFDAVGQLSLASNGEHTVIFERDALGRIVNERQDAHAVSSSYDALGGLLRTATSLGGTADYLLDANGGVAKLTLQGRHTIEFGRDEYGQAVTADLPGDIRLRQRFDPMGRLLEQSLSRAGGAQVGIAAAALQRRYHYDPAGKVSAVEDGPWGRTDYAYDPAERLIQSLSRHGREPGISERFDYDPAGNLVRQQREGAEFTDERLGYAPGNRLVERGGTRYEHDACGRLKTKTTADGRCWVYSWNALNQLTRLRLPDGRCWRYGYDALGRRIWKAEASADDSVMNSSRRDFVWDKDVLAHEVPHDGPVQFWAFDPHGFAPLASVQGERFFSIVTDQLGDTLEFIATDGSSAWSGRRTAWGEPDPRTQAAQPAVNPWAYAGQYRDDESGLHYNYFRYYDPADGRYISPDPVGLEGGFNLYKYTANPANWSDPYGLTCPHDTNGGEGYVVYHIKDGLGNVLYVGITQADRFRTREQEHTDSNRLSGGRTMDIAAEAPTYGAARGFEQAHIEHYGTRDTSLIGNYDYQNNPGNRINSFDTSRTDDRANVYNTHHRTAMQGLRE
ncbi:MAG: hypothetical protein M3Y32_12420, partial [Pseudomonadota bacterium]|nr:hypothetical protein [Pseudomonadota bacterium]